MFFTTFWDHLFLNSRAAVISFLPNGCGAGTRDILPPVCNFGAEKAAISHSDTNMSAALLLLSIVAACNAAVDYNPNMKLFGHSIKNGQLPAHTELTTFEHTCTTAPCVVTQLHVPSIYPRGENWDWQDGRLVSVFARLISSCNRAST